MSSLTYRDAAAADLPFIVHLMTIDDVSGSDEPWGGPGHPSYAQALAAIDADNNQLLLIVEEAGAPVGTFQLTFIPGLMRNGMWRCLVEGVHVSPDHRNKGIGKAMMAWAIDTARTRGCGMVQLTSNKKRVDAHRFYRTLGFTQTHEGFKYFT